MRFYILFDIGMAAITFVTGILFYRSNGKAAKFLSGYNMKTSEERKRYDEPQMCRSYGKRMMYMAVSFLVGAVIDVWFAGAGCFVAWGVWFLMFILLLAEMHKREG